MPKETHTNNQVILRRNSERFRHEKPFLPKVKVQGLEELLDIFQIPGEESNVKDRQSIQRHSCLMNSLSKETVLIVPLLFHLTGKSAFQHKGNVRSELSWTKPGDAYLICEQKKVSKTILNIHPCEQAPAILTAATRFSYISFGRQVQELPLSKIT